MNVLPFPTERAQLRHRFVRLVHLDGTEFAMAGFPTDIRDPGACERSTMSSTTDSGAAISISIDKLSINMLDRHCVDQAI